jgi:Ca-activated chloride channel family protein
MMNIALLAAGDFASKTMKIRLIPTLPTSSQFLALFASALFLVGYGHGQSANRPELLPPNDSNGPTSMRGAMDSEAHGSNTPRPLRVDVDLVLLPVTVSDPMNHAVTSLKKEDFAIYEGNQQQEIRYFSTEDAPISVAILLDVSKSMSDKIETERAALVEFFNNANPNDEYFAIAFSDRPRVLVDSTQSIEQLQGQLLSAEPGGPTAMLDAVYLALSELRSARYERKAILILSDGGDNASRYKLREIKSLVQESDVQIYAVGLFETFFFNTIEERLGKVWLGEITDVTGGRTITVDNRGKVPEAAATISREMRNQYVLGYRPTTTAGTKWRKIKVRLTSSAEPPLRAYYKQGYLPMH